MASTHHGVVYTKKWVVDLILDVAGYVPGTGISDKVIIEPSCGCGAFLTVIAGRLADDAIAVGKGWTSLVNAIRAYDIDSASIETARKAAVEDADLKLQVQPLAIISYILWWMGDERAMLTAMRALAIDEECSLAAIVAAAIHGDQWPNRN